MGLIPKSPKNSTNNYIGVVFNEKLQKWHAQIMVNRKHINLGYFQTEKEALLSRLKGEKLYWAITLRNDTYFIYWRKIYELFTNYCYGRY